MVKKTISIQKDTREMLRELQTDTDSSVDMVINRLLDDVNEDMQNTIFLTGRTSIDLNVDTMSKIKAYKIHEHESYDSILRRALSLYLSK